MTGIVLSQKLKRPPPRINLGKRLLNNRTSPPPTPIKGESPETYPYLRVGGGEYHRKSLSLGALQITNTCRFVFDKYQTLAPVLSESQHLSVSHHN